MALNYRRPTTGNGDASTAATGTVDFRADNDRNFESLKKTSIDLYSSLKSIYLQDRENKINNSTKDDDDWGNLDN